MAQISIDTSFSKEDSLPICPHCNQKLNKIKRHRVEDGPFLCFIIFYCWLCNKVLSISIVKKI
jgi:uncharacterized protein with PIN domain